MDACVSSDSDLMLYSQMSFIETLMSPREAAIIFKAGAHDGPSTPICFCVTRTQTTLEFGAELNSVLAEAVKDPYFRTRRVLCWKDRDHIV